MLLESMKGRKNVWIGCLVCIFVLVACSDDDFHPVAEKEGPVVLLVTGSLIADDFFDVMSRRLAKAGFRPVVFQPPDLLTESLEIGARRISDAVAETLSTYGQDRVHIVAECNGGIASRYFVEKLGGFEYVDRFISFVSAHNGTRFFKIPWYDALADIRPGSPFMEKLENSIPPENTTTEISIYVCNDEIMDPYTSPRLPGAALNIEVCDAAFDLRALEREPYDVKSLIGGMLIRLYPLHLSGFWDEPFFRLVLSCISDDVDTIREFDLLDVSFY